MAAGRSASRHRFGMDGDLGAGVLYQWQICEPRRWSGGGRTGWELKAEVEGEGEWAAELVPPFLEGELRKVEPAQCRMSGCR